MTQKKTHFYETAIGKIVIGVSIFVTGQLLLFVGWFIMTSGQPPVCKQENAIIKQSIIEVVKVQSENNKSQTDFINYVRNNRFLDSVNRANDRKILILLAKKQGIDESYYK